MGELINYDGSLYCIGNGNIAAYFIRGEMYSLFGPPYSSPSALCMQFADNISMPLPSKRIENSAVWHSKLFKAGKEIGETTDFVLYDGTPCIIRKINADESFEMNLKFSPDLITGKTVINSEKFNKGVYADCRKVLAGNDIFAKGVYPYPFDQFYQTIIFGDAFKIENNNNDDVLNICFNKGESYVLFIGGTSYDDCFSCAKKITEMKIERLLEDTLEHWDAFFKKCAFENLIPKNAYRYNEIIEAIKSTAINILTQQASQGGVLAGYNYHFGYVRDQYGVSRALIKMGILDNAKKILEYYYNIFIEFGYYKNAQGLGVKGLFHTVVNDKAEITAYVIIQAFDYLKASGDMKFMNMIYPMLKWSLDSQIEVIASDMLPFNGDETYIAGGIMPYSVVDDGSAESTMLFLISAELMISYIKRNNNENEEEIAIIELIVEKIKKSYKKKFIRNNKFIANNTSREGAQNKDGKEYIVPSVTLMPYYMGFDLVDRSIIESTVDDFVNEISQIKNGNNSSEINERYVGYDYGLFLFNAHKMNLKYDRLLIDLVLEKYDECGSWAEYYDYSKPAKTRYRPWESGINIEALIVALS